MPIKSLDRVFVLNLTVILEAILLLVATVWCFVSQLQLLPALSLTTRPFQVIAIGLLCGLATAASGVLLIWLGKRFGNSLRILGGLHDIVVGELAPIFGKLLLCDIFIVAASSGFCEEVFFRGVVQAKMGLPLASLLFGFFHLPSLRHLPYGLWAAAAGMFLGSIYLFTHSLWTPILAHGTSNLLVLLYLKYAVKPKPPAEPPASEES